MEEKIDKVILDIEGSSFSASLTFLNSRLIAFFINYYNKDENFTIDGSESTIGADRYYYIDENDKEQTKEIIDFETPEDKDLLAKFNEEIMRQYREKIAKRQITESEAKQLLLELLDYIDNITKGGIVGLTEKVRSVIRSENVKIEFSRPEIILK
mgnify:CR=1 FL=1